MTLISKTIGMIPNSENFKLVETVEDEKGILQVLTSPIVGWRIVILEDSNKPDEDHFDTGMSIAVPILIDDCTDPHGILCPNGEVIEPSNAAWPDVDSWLKSKKEEKEEEQEKARKKAAK